MDRLLRVPQAGSLGEDYAENPLNADPEDGFIEIVAVTYLDGYKLRLRFNDGKEQEIDFEPFLAGSGNPLIKTYLQPNLFKSYSVEYGDLVWNDYDLCFPLIDLYEGRI